ncbi:MAG: hypothetical protein R3F22_12005 [Lysobacteraceae bacterium]
MSSYEALSLIIQFSLAVVAAVTVIVYFQQLRTMSSQLITMQKSSDAHSALALVHHLQSPDIRDARTAVRRELSKKPFDEWTDQERQLASSVVANYDVAAAIIRSGLAPLELISENWGPSIVHCHAVLSPFIAQVREREHGCEKYWSNFDWLADQTKKRALGILRT